MSSFPKFEFKSQPQITFGELPVGSWFTTANQQPRVYVKVATAEEPKNCFCLTERFLTAFSTTHRVVPVKAIVQCDTSSTT